MKRYFLLLAIIFGFSLTMQSQRQLKDIRTSLKSKNGGEALKKVTELEKDSAFRTNPKLYDFGKQAQILINDAENEKIYLKQPYDTAKFFNSTYGIIDYILKCEKAEQVLLASKGGKQKYQKENANLLHRYYPNLNAACKYWYSKGKYADAQKFLRMCLDLPNTEMWGTDKSVCNKKSYIRNAYFHLKSSYELKDYATMKEYETVALKDTMVRRHTFYYMSLGSQALQEEKSYLSYLKKGLTEFPQDPFFFTRLTDYYMQQNDYKASLLLADTLLTIDSTNLYFLEAKTLALLNLGRNEEAIQCGLKSLQIDSTQISPNYYVGAAYCNLANDIQLPTNINSKAYKKANSMKKEFYGKAQPYPEVYKEQAPDKKSRWAPLLYRIYLSLNKGAQFAEIEKILKTIS